MSGRVDPETIHTRWLVKSREADLAGLLQAALEKKEVGKALEGLLPARRFSTTRWSERFAGFKADTD